MFVLEFFSKLSTHKGLCIVIILIGNIVAPFWFLFQFTPHLFETVDMLRLVLLCISLGTPITTIGCLLIGGGWFVLKPKNIFDASKLDLADSVLAVVSYGSLITAITFYSPAALLVKGTWVSLKSAVSFSFLVAVIYYGVVMVGLMMIDFALVLRMKKKPKASSSPTTPAQDPPSSQP
jgi:hypothetical protein